MGEHSVISVGRMRVAGVEGQSEMTGVGREWTGTSEGSLVVLKGIVVGG